MSGNTTLRDLIKEVSSRPVAAEIEAIAMSVRARYEADVVAILGYGSCLRGEHVTDTLVDLYVLVEDYKTAHENILSRVGNFLLPPNVYYQECSFNTQIIRCKYAVISLDQLHRKVSNSTKNPYFWARFSQPTAVIYARDTTTRQSVIDALMCAVTTTLEEAEKLAPGAPALDMWTQILTHTYATELRSERAGRAAGIVMANPDYFTALHDAVMARAALPRDLSSGASDWPRRRFTGKVLSVLRLIKAAFTFDGGADYLAWKINRHSGIEINLSPWQRRHPILAAPKLFWQLYAKGAFR